MAHSRSFVSFLSRLHAIGSAAGLIFAGRGVSLSPVRGAEKDGPEAEDPDQDHRANDENDDCDMEITQDQTSLGKSLIAQSSVTFADLIFGQMPGDNGNNGT